MLITKWNFLEMKILIIEIKSQLNQTADEILREKISELKSSSQANFWNIITKVKKWKLRQRGYETWRETHLWGSRKGEWRHWKNSVI